jgi:dihydroorotase
MYDLLISGGHLIDPSQSIDAPRDVAIHQGRVTEIAPHIDPAHATRSVDATGCYVTPGLIDYHTHGYWGVSHYGIDLDRHALGRGVTTVLDVGSAGAQTWSGFRHHVIERSNCRILAYLNISMAGMIAQQVGECEELRYLDPDFAARTVEENRDLLLGIKVRQSRNVVGGNGLEPLRRAIQAARAAGVPIMVHVGDTPEPLDRILELMRPGDTLTHFLHGQRYGVLDDGGRVLPAVWDAERRGVHLDVGHGTRSFIFETAQSAVDQGLLPTTISSDAHAHSVPGPAGDLVTTMSKFLMLGLPLHEVIRKTTEVPAQLLGMAGKLGTLRPGAEGDVAVLRLEDGEFVYRDCSGEERKWDRRLEPVAVVKGGRECPVYPAA